MKLRRGALALTAIAICALSPAAADATYPGRNGVIAFGSDYAGNCGQEGPFCEDVTQIQVLRNRRFDRVVACDASMATFSPSGRIAFVKSGVGIQFTKLKTSKPPTTVPGTKRAFSPVWSPSGKRFAYSVVADAETGRSSVYVIRRDGTSRRKLTGNGSVDDWSVNGRILFHRQGNRAGLYSMNAGGKHVRRLTSPPRFRDDPDREVFDRGGSWSPDGRRMAFSRSAAHLEDVYVANADGSGLHEFAQGGRWPAWSPNGKRLAYVSVYGEDIHIERADGRGPIHLPMTRPQHGTSSCGSESFGTGESGGIGRLAWQPRPRR